MFNFDWLNFSFTFNRHLRIKKQNGIENLCFALPTFQIGSGGVTVVGGGGAEVDDDTHMVPAPPVP